MEDLALRREWRKRIEDHDGSAKGEGHNEGGIERWLVLAEGVGLDRANVVSGSGILPATRFAVEAYVRFVREPSLLGAVASSLTELFAPKIPRAHIAGLLAQYPLAHETTITHTAPPLRPTPPPAPFGA